LPWTSPTPRPSWTPSRWSRPRGSGRGRRRPAGRPGEGGLWLHAGSGAGPAIPHVEALRQERRTSGYQLTGPAWAILAGLEWNPIPWLGLVLEARMSRALLDMDLAGGDKLRTRIGSLAITGGLAVRF